jgi:RNA polymerase sigma factor (sigma-70 family)
MGNDQTYLHLWQQIIKGDRQAFSELFDASGKELINYAYKVSLDRALAKDAVQDVFVDLWLYRSNLNQDVQVRFYLYRCVRRAIEKLMKNESFESYDSEIQTLNALTDEMSPEVRICRIESENQQDLQLEKSLKSLSEREREIVTLKYYSNLKLKEIADLLGLKEQTVANTLQNALSKLRRQLSYLVSLLIFLFFI